MAKNDNLKDFLTDIANTIREKKGTADLINPQDFATEIAALGGGSSDIEYYTIDWSKAEEVGWVTNGILNREVLANVFSVFFEVKMEASGMVQYTTAGILYASSYAQSQTENYILAIKMFSFKPCSIKTYQDGNLLVEQNYNTFSDAYPGQETQGIISRITKEQFYSLE